MEKYLPNIFFALILVTGIGYFVMNVRKLIRNIKLGKDIDRTDRKPERWKNMAKIALGQYKMVRRPVSGILHIVVYVGFILINIELLEIVIDGINREDIELAMKVGISEILNSRITKGISKISAGNYGGKLGPYLFKLKDLI